MASTLGAPLARPKIGRVYVFGALGFAAVSSVGAFRGEYGWGVTEWSLGFAAIFCCLSWLRPTRRENVQVNDTGVTVVTRLGRDEIRWSDVVRARVITTSDGPMSDDVFFVLETDAGKGCVVPLDAAVRTQLLAEMQARLAGVDNGKVVEAMGSTRENVFVIWERPSERISERAGGQANIVRA